MGSAIHTIGHSTRPIETFIDLLRASGVTRLIDVRAVPRSRFNPQYNRDVLAQALDAAGIDYRHMPSLGGLRKPNDGDSPNDFWREGFRGFADYALTPEFRVALDKVEMLADERPTAVMCAEANWRNCHRQIIADWLLADGRHVRHIVSPDVVEDAQMNPAAERRPDGSLVYLAKNAPAKAKGRKSKADPRAPRLPGL